jgi:hypothetical protein
MKPRRGASALDALLRLWMRDPVERAAYRLATAYMWRDREMMMRLWPGLAALILLPLVTLLERRPNVQGFVLFASFMLGSTPAIAGGVLETSSHYAAAEIFRIAPLADTAPLLHGVRKAVLAGMLLPASLVMLGISLVATRGNWGAIAGLVPALLLVPASSLLPGVVGQYVPLAQQSRRGMQETRAFALYFPLFVGIPVIALAARWAQRQGKLLTFVAVELVAVVVLQFVLLRTARRRGRILPAEE